MYSVSATKSTSAKHGRMPKLKFGSQAILSKVSPSFRSTGMCFLLLSHTQDPTLALLLLTWKSVLKGKQQSEECRQVIFMFLFFPYFTLYPVVHE